MPSVCWIFGMHKSIVMSLSGISGNLIASFKLVSHMEIRSYLKIELCASIKRTR